MYTKNLTMHEIYHTIPETEIDFIDDLFNRGLEMENDRLAVSALEELLRRKRNDLVTAGLDKATECGHLRLDTPMTTLIAHVLMGLPKNSLLRAIGEYAFHHPEHADDLAWFQAATLEHKWSSESPKAPKSATQMPDIADELSPLERTAEDNVAEQLWQMRLTYLEGDKFRAILPTEEQLLYDQAYNEGYARAKNSFGEKLEPKHDPFPSHRYDEIYKKAFRYGAHEYHVMHDGR